jgi:hypothetical protein
MVVAVVSFTLGLLVGLFVMACLQVAADHGERTVTGRAPGRFPSNRRP